MRLRLSRCALPVGLLVLVIDASACGGGGDGRAPSDAATDRSVPPGDSSGADASMPGDDGGVTADAAVDGEAPPSVCDDACRENTLLARFSDTTRTFERAFYGLTTGPTPATMHVEAHGGADGACPTESSPSPDRTIVIAGLSRPAADGAATAESVSLLDFEGALLPAVPVESASSFSLDVTAIDVCPACVGEPPPSDPDGFVALTLTATFADGEVSGHIFASHCDSMDE